MNNQNMDIRVKKIESDQREVVEIQCHKVTSQVKEIVRFVKSRQERLTGRMDERQYEIPLMDIYYIEGVDNKVFLCCKDQVYETKQKLYELEEVLNKKQFLRVSKSVILNLMKTKSMKPAMNGRFLACLQNGEEIMISRKYAATLRATIKGGVKDER